MTTQPDYHADIAATVAACADGGNDAKIIIPVQHARGLLEQVDELRRANARLANLYDAAWAECETWRAASAYNDLFMARLNEIKPEDKWTAHDALRKEAGL